MKRICIFLLQSLLALGAAHAQEQWHKIISLPPGGSIKDLATDDAGTVYALTSVHSNIFYTTDNGLHWTLMPNTTDLWLAEDIEVNKNTGALYLGSQWFGIEWTYDKGLHWSEQRFHSIPGGFYAEITQVGFKNGTNTVVAAENLDFNSVFHISFNGGTTWSAPVTTPFGATNDLKFLSGGTLLAGTSNGIARSLDDGMTWAPSGTGIGNKQVMSITEKTANGHVFAAAKFNFATFDTTGCGVYQSTDGGHTWMYVSASIGHPVVSVVYDSVHDNLYAVTPFNGLYASGDEGATWTAVNTGLVTPENNCIEIGNSGLFAGTGRSGVAFSETPASGWEYRNNNMFIYTVNNMAVSHHGIDIHSLDLEGAGAYKLDAMGWTHQYNGLPYGSWGQEIVTDGNDVLYASYNKSNHGVYRSKDNGNTWQDITAAIPMTVTSAVASYRLRTDRHNNVYVITDIDGISEVFRSTDTGNTFTSFLPAMGVQIYSDLDFGHDAIYVTTVGFGEAINVSHDDGLTYDTVAFNLGDLYESNLVVAENDSLYLQQHAHIFKRNGINNWFQLPDGGWTPEYFNYPNSLYIDKESHLFVSSDKHGVYYCANDTTWTNISEGLPMYSTVYEPDSIRLTPSQIAFDRDNVPYAICSYRYAGELQGIYKFSVPPPVSVNTTSPNATIAIYPNPATDQLYITHSRVGKDPLSVQVYNISGQLIITQTMTGNSMTMNVSGFVPGMYIVRCVESGSVQTVRFIKK